MGKIISTFQNIEYDFEPLLIDQLPLLEKEKMIDSRMAREILQANFEQLFINHVLGRSNLRPADDSVETISKDREEIKKRWYLLKDRDDARRYIFKNNLLFVIKQVDLLPFLDFIYKAFKNVKIIHIVRNAFDVAFSIEKKKWYSDYQLKNVESTTPRKKIIINNKKYFVPWWLSKERTTEFIHYSDYKRSLLSWICLFESFFKFKNKTSIMNKNNYFQIKYEELLTNSENVIGKISNFINKKSTSKTKKILRKINPNNLYKNKKYSLLDVFNQKNIKEARRLMEKLGVIRNIWFYPYSLATLNKWNFLSLTPLTTVLKFFNFALNDSAEAFVLRLIK